MDGRMEGTVFGVLTEFWGVLRLKKKGEDEDEEGGNLVCLPAYMPVLICPILTHTHTHTHSIACMRILLLFLCSVPSCSADLLEVHVAACLLVSIRVCVYGSGGVVSASSSESCTKTAQYGTVQVKTRQDKTRQEQKRK
jgi:hypothetical protein